MSRIVSQVFYDISSSPIDLSDIWPVACWVLLWLKSPLLTCDHFSCVTSHMDYLTNTFRHMWSIYRICPVSTSVIKPFCNWALWPDADANGQMTRCHLPDDSCFDKISLDFAKLSEDGFTCRPNLTPTNVWLLSKFSNNACCIINCKILGLQIWKVTILMHYVFESNCETMCAVFVQYVDSHT